MERTHPVGQSENGGGCGKEALADGAATLRGTYVLTRRWGRLGKDREDVREVIRKG